MTLLVSGIYIFLASFRYNSGKQKLLVPLVYLSAAILIQFAWKIHVDGAFSQGFASSKFTVGIGLFSNPQIPVPESILRVFGSALLGNDQYAPVFLLANMLSLLLLSKPASKELGASLNIRVRDAFLVSNSLLISYLAVLVVVYAFIMPAGESKTQLASFNRYYGTVLFSFAYLQVATQLELLGKFGQIPKSAIATGEPSRRALHFLASCITLALSGSLLIPGLCHVFGKLDTFHLSSEYILFEKLAPEREATSIALRLAKKCVPTHTRTVVYFDENAPSYRRYLGIYELDSPISQIQPEMSDAEIDALLLSTEYLVIAGMDGNEFIGRLADLGWNVVGATGAAGESYRIHVEGDVKELALIEPAARSADDARSAM